MREIFEFSDEMDRKNRKPATRRCFGCGRLIRQYETGFEATGLCEDCQYEAEKQAELDNAALDEDY